MKHTRLKQVLSGLAILTLSASLTAGHDHDKREDRERESEGFSFAMIGDVPYGVAPYSDYPPFDNLIDEINERRDIRWIIHTGDIKSSSTECSDELFYDRLDRYNQFKRPFIYTPGDNEWTDCHRVKAGEYKPLERLQKLRQVFFSEPGRTIGGKRMRVESQAFVAGFEEFPENVRWEKDDVLFASIHVVGSNNGLKAFDPASATIRSAADDAEVARRIDAALYWIDETFDIAVEEDAPGVLIMMQANPVLEIGYALPKGDDLAAARTGFTEILSKLEQRAIEFDKPVVLAHGDSHEFRVDKPGLVENSFLPNFTRVENFGSSCVHWVEISVDADSDEVFSFQPMVIEANH
ncbi:MAG: metallophosphoesterase [Candidatus Thiodiazotropha sp. (ex Monitilora ramsayi)]|nr:metallophosphoesterase [Candidatus Thiodiazotropha sp. (ex Monitilora ramsayi)]